MTFLGPENFVRFEKHQKAFSGALRGAFFEKRTPEVLVTKLARKWLVLYVSVRTLSKSGKEKGRKRSFRGVLYTSLIDGERNRFE